MSFTVFELLEVILSREICKNKDVNKYDARTKGGLKKKKREKQMFFGKMIEHQNHNSHASTINPYRVNYPPFGLEIANK